MKTAPARAMRMDVFSRISKPFEFGQYGVSFFTAGLLALLLLIIGVPIAMVVLMSLRTGFPGEGGPLTLQNFVDVYADTAHLRNRRQHAAVRPGFRGWWRWCSPYRCLVAHAHGYSVQKNHLRVADGRHSDSGVSAHHRLDSFAQSADRSW